MATENATDFDTLDPATMTDKDAAALVALSADEDDVTLGVSSRKGDRWKFFLDDHWQGAAGYIGAVPDGEAGTVFLAEVEKSFVFYNVVKEVALRAANAVASREPRWGAVLSRVLAEDEKPSDAEDLAIGARDGLMREWWNYEARATYTDRKDRLVACSVRTVLHRAAAQFVVTGRAALRVFIPPGLRNEQGVLPDVPLAEALDRIYVELCPRGGACVHVARGKMQQIGVYVWKSGDKVFTEISYCEKQGAERLTILREVKEAEEAPPGEGAASTQAPPSFPLAGALFHHEMRGEPMIDDSIISQQKSVNKTLTMGDRAMTMAGFPERVLTETALNGEWVPDPANAGKKKLINVKPFVFGPASVNVLSGNEYSQGDGKGITRTTPSYDRLEPMGSDVYDNAFEKARERMLDAVSQTHVKISGDATASGVSREQARHEFNKSIGALATHLGSAGFWLLNTVWDLAKATSTEKATDGLFFDFNCDVDLGPRDGAALAEDRERVKDELLSPETAMARDGVEDTDSESNRVQSARATSRAGREARATEFEILTRGGAGALPAAQVAGYGKDETEILGRSDFVPESPADATVDVASLQSAIAADESIADGARGVASTIFDAFAGVSLKPDVTKEILVAAGIAPETAQDLVDGAGSNNG